MTRPVWSGSISFGLVNVPVKAYTAVRDHTIHFHQLEQDTGARIRYQKISEQTGEPVEAEDIVSGYETSKGHYVTFARGELDAPGVGQVASRQRRRRAHRFAEQLGDDRCDGLAGCTALPGHLGVVRPGRSPAASGMRSSSTWISAQSRSTTGRSAAKYSGTTGMFSRQM